MYPPWATSNDSSVWTRECEFYCDSEVFPESTQWPNTQAISATGVCMDGFTGSPQRLCLRAGTQRVWNNTITSPCQQITSLEQIQSHGTYLLFPIIPFALLVTLKLLSVCFPSLNFAAVLLQFFFSLGTLIANCIFVSAIGPYALNLDIPSIVFLVFWFTTNVGLLVWIFASGFGTRQAAQHGYFGLACLLSWVDLSTLDAVKSFAPVVHTPYTSLIMSNVFFQYLPLLVLQIVSLSLYSPIISIVAIFFNCFSLGYAFVLELSQWALHLRQGSSPRSHPEMSMENVMKQQPLEGSSNPPSEAPYSKFLSYCFLPVVLVSLLPQFMSLFGIPFALDCVRRFLEAASQIPRSRASEGTLASRGFFLLSLNVASFVGALLVILAIVTPPALLLLALHGVKQKVFRSEGLTLFADYRASVQGLFSSLLFAYFPFLKTPPPVREESQESTSSPGRWKMALAIFLFFVFEIALPVSSMVTDFTFAANLLSVYNHDPTLGERHNLWAWAVVCFISAVLGVMIDLGRLLTDTSRLSQNKFSRETLGSYVLSVSPFGHPSSRSIPVQIFLLFGLFAEDVLQIIIVCQTTKFTGGNSALEYVKLGLSIASASLSLAKFITNFTFGRKITSLSRTVLRGLYFSLFAMALAVLVNGIYVGNYCSLTRTLSAQDDLTEFATCQSVVANLTLTGFPTNVTSPPLVAVSISSPLAIVNNSATVALDFQDLGNMSSTLTVSGNSGPLSLSFVSLTSLPPGSTISIEDNSDDLIFSAPSLLQVEEGANVTVVGNTGKAPFSLLASVNTLAGSAEFTSNSFSNIDLGQLLALEGDLVLVGNTGVTNLEFPLLTVLDGNLLISDNPLIQSVNFPSLRTGRGQVVIQGNANLVSVSIPVAKTVNSILLRGNPRLTSLYVYELDGAQVFVSEGSNNLTTVSST